MVFDIKKLLFALFIAHLMDPLEMMMIHSLRYKRVPYVRAHSFIEDLLYFFSLFFEKRPIIGIYAFKVNYDIFSSVLKTP